MASTSIENIWDEPAAPASPRPRSPTPDDSVPPPAKRRRSSEPLFLADDDEGDVRRQPSPPAASTSAMKELDELFADLDNEELSFEPLAPSLDITEIRRKAEQRNALSTPHEVAPSSSPPRDLDGGEGKDAPKARKKIARLDEARLLGPTGFPVLIKSTKEFKPRGKGHEAEDLHRLLNVYQFWTHKMYPKTQFRDTVQRVEKLTHSRRMHAAMQGWRDDAHGKNKDPEEAFDLTSDAEEGVEGRQQPVEAVEDSDAPADVSRPPSHPPASASEPEPDFDDMDMDGTLHRHDLSANTSVSSSSRAPVSFDEDEEAMWNDIDAPAARTASQPHVRTAPEDEDEEMWDMVREMEADATIAQKAPAQQKTQPISEEEWEEMYEG